MGEINEFKNQDQEIMLENDKVSFEEVQEWANKYCDTVVRYDIPMDVIESKLRSSTERENRMWESRKKEEWSR